EDGIRDRNVTGVQTCALPISSCWHSSSPPARAPERQATPIRARPPPRVWRHEARPRPSPCPPRRRRRRPGKVANERFSCARLTRSEARRVGKEGRAREEADTG